MFKGRRALLFSQVQVESQIFRREGLSPPFPECVLTINL